MKHNAEKKQTLGPSQGNGLKTTESEVRHLSGESLGLPWIDELASVYSHEALTMDWYRHDDLEVICLEHGEMVYEIIGRGTVDLKAGHLLVIPARSRHRLIAGIDAPSRRVSFKLRRLAESEHPSPFNRKIYDSLRRQLAARAAQTYPLSPRAKMLELRLGALLHCNLRLSSLERTEAAAIAPLLFIDCATASPKQPEKSSAALIDSAKRYLQEHLAERIPMDALVSHVGYCRSRFFELFKAETGLSPNDYLQRIRIERARELLKDPLTSVQSAALSVGFPDARYFSRVFKRLTSFQPSAARR